MKINKKSWHYRLIRWSVEGHCHSLLTSEDIDSRMPQTLCLYLYKLLAVFVSIFAQIFLVISSFAFMAMIILIHLHEMKRILLTLLAFGVFTVIGLLVYGLIRVFVWKPIQKWQSNHCPKIDYE